MARWLLEEDHYLHSPGTEWEHKEVDPVTNRQLRKIYKVPLYMEKGWTVCDGNNCQKGDVIFEGPPGPRMSPLDDDAIAISAQYEKDWQEHPIDSLPTTGGYGHFNDPGRVDLRQTPIEIARPKTAVPPTGTVRRI